MKRQSGFTFLELIVLIVVVGLLVGIAVPRFIDQKRNERIAALHGLSGALNSVVMLSQAEYKAEGASVSKIMLSGISIAVTTTPPGGFPTGSPAGIGAAIRSATDFSPTYGATTQWDFFNAVKNCNVQYVAATGAITVNTSGC